MDMFWNRVNGWKKCDSTGLLKRPSRDDDNAPHIELNKGVVINGSVYAATEHHARILDVMPAIAGECKGLKCDNPSCDWEDMSIPRSAFESWRNQGCPQCDSNVLTDADYRLLLKLDRIMAVVNWWHRKTTRRFQKSEAVQSIPMGADGNGNLVRREVVV